MDLFPNQTVIFQWLLFMTAFFALHFGVFRPVLHLIRQRKDRTSGERERVEQLNQRIETLVAQCTQKLDEGRKAGILERERSLQEAESESRHLIQSVKQEIEKEIDGARSELDRQMRSLSMQVNSYAQELGREIAGKVLERGV
ncbi:MAG: ATP synthase F0 subunit B [Deltaproteobacteria bacterium]|nr:ATP synthase F0 subunit B [Deltaproteobacteria bacterium]